MIVDMNNKIELIGHYGSDKIIALSAWTSTSRNLSQKKRDRIPNLINNLWIAGHETPFEKGSVHFLVDCDIASHVQLLKHRMSSLNAESARYKELKEDKMYIPEDWNVIPSDEVYHPFMRDERKTIFDWKGVLEKYNTLGNELYHRAVDDLTPTLGRKRAKESARYFKTYSSQIKADVMFNMRSFANFLKLRNSEHAQLEIREIAQEMLTLVENIEGNPFKHTLQAWKNK
jgi:thymidylate synthase (FAD)